MAEQYPSSATLLALSNTVEAETGVGYVTKGAGLDWYNEFVQYLWAIHRAIMSCAGLRIYQDADETYAVRTGKWLYKDTEYSYTASTGNALTDNATNYIYLTLNGTLTVSTSAFPNSYTTPHIRLATIVKGNDGVAYDPDSDVVDYRQENLWAVQTGENGQIVCYDNEVVCYENQVVYI